MPFNLNSPMRKFFLLMIIPLLVFGCSSQPPTADPLQSEDTAQPADTAQPVETTQEGEPYPRIGMGMRSGMGMRHHARIPAGYSGLSNPVEPDGGSIQRGGELYETHCASCHGESGLGEGPAGVNLDPPASPIAHTSQMLSDDYLFWRISEGGTEFETAMPAWKNILEEDQIWDLMNYFRVLGREGKAAIETFQAERQDEMLSAALDQGLIDKAQANSFKLVHEALEDFMVSHSDLAGSMDERESAALQALIEGGTLSAAQVNTFIEVHDLLSASGLMP